MMTMVRVLPGKEYDAILMKRRMARVLVQDEQERES